MDAAGTAVLILGDKGSGKTSLLRCLVERGYYPAGDDLVVVGAHPPTVWPGNRLSRRRPPAGVSGAYERRIIEVSDPGQFWHGSATIGHVVRVNLYPANPTPAMWDNGPDGLQEALRLHENLGRYIRGVATPFYWRDGVPVLSLPYLDDASCMRTRARIVSLTFGMPIRYLSARPLALLQTRFRSWGEEVTAHSLVISA